MATALPIPLTPFPWGDIAIILALIALNGVLAMSELAIVSARRARLESITKKSQLRGAKTALLLASNPGRFLSTVQIGITLIGIIAGAYSGASLGGPVAERLKLLGVPAQWSDDISFTLVVGLTTFASLIVGELVPKQFALRAPEPIAVVMAMPMVILSRVTAPLVWLLDRTSALIFRILGMNRESDSHVTAEELHLIVAEASKSDMRKLARMQGMVTLREAGIVMVRAGITTLDEVLGATNEDDEQMDPVPTPTLAPVTPPQTMIVTVPQMIPAPVAAVEQTIIDTARDGRFSVKEIVFDPARWQRTFMILDEEGLPVVQYPNSAERMVPATQKFYEAVVNESFTHDGDERLARHISNCVTKQSSRGVMVAKASSKRKVDAAVASIFGYDRATQPAEPKKPVARFFSLEL
jgi:hypothetical protein